MKYFLYLMGPTIMILIGLQGIKNIPITFLLFYSWLLAVPLFKKEIYLIGFTRNNLWKSIGLGLSSGLLFYLFIFGGLFWLHQYFIDLEHLQVLLENWGFFGKGIIGLTFILIVINPILEEVYWRGFMHQRLKKEMKTIHAIWITSFFYTLYHFLSVIPMFQWPLNVIAVLPVFAAGIFWGYLREKTGSIYGTIVSHMLGDFGILCVYWFIVK
ncbi:membrane protease YdiL (CAAX protease family) [Bacillus pakistanensis]|uniref:Membrane protease YdiL (CAAX protease family) n=1 Tax=Rossellomorea pakistanensis TaxID=992288 RepID=A0ABS2NH33_9BACI|nr:type II CAAX endopeptidase family protein [Bacillus pakistanensis]MBM7587167.1 membrane protease YdiL (CAAX protease family) [Bacillus pakistanensis]